MLAFFRKFWKDQDTVEKKFFWMVLFIEVFVTWISGVFTYFENLSLWAYLSCFISCGIVCCLGVVAYKTKEYGICYMGSFYTIGLVLMPAAFFFCGGVKSGMPMYSSALMLVGAVAPVSTKRKLIAFIIVLLWMGAAMIFSLSGTDLSKKLLTEVSEQASALDVVVSYIFMSITIYCIGAFIVRAYANECDKREKLVARLDYLSKRDYLTELYNRRYLIQYLESVVWAQRDKFYLVMYDVDDFKSVNDTYGHFFGDQVLCDLSKIILDFVDEKNGECAVRYGGEEFIYILKGDSEVEAYAKADKIREAVNMHQWEEAPMLHVTVSAGFMSCRSRRGFDHKELLHKVDELMFMAKSKGKNHIRNVSE
ncbi:MAG: GGDEF domain-containing protein [Fibrobacter sp.]|nr:GGDEF domain-containing protein [Fibrobacter sp.]